MAKKLFQALTFLLVIPLMIGFVLLAFIVKKGGLFIAFSQFMSLFPGKFGSYLRTAFYSVVMTGCDRDCVIGFGTLFSQYDTEIESGVYIGPQCNIGLSRIGKNSLLGSGVHIVSGKRQHNFSDLETPIKDQGGVFEKVVIGEDCWVGNGAIIMANIGQQCVIGAGAVVTEDVPDFAIMAGNPAKLVKMRIGKLPTP